MNVSLHRANNHHLFMLFLALGSFKDNNKVKFIFWKKITQIPHVALIAQLDGAKSYIPANQLGFLSHLVRSTPLEPAAPVCWCGQPLETMAESGRTLTSSCPTPPLSEWPSRRRWVGTCGRTSPWMTSPTQKSVWWKVKKSHLWALLCESNFPARILRVLPSLLFFSTFSFHQQQRSSSVSIWTAVAV